MALEPPNSVADQLLAHLPASPDVYPQKLDLVQDAVLLIRLDASAYRAASFLDDRILGPNAHGAWLPASVVDDAAYRIRRECAVHFIFHTGHVGSTLISRLLDEGEDVLPLREPLPLRTLADAHDALGLPESLLSDAQFDLRLKTFLKLWGRGYDTTRSAVVKATSSAGRMAVPILSRTSASRAICVNLRAEPYLAALLAGRNSPVDLRAHGPGRIRRLQRRLDTPLAPLHSLSIGELAAMSWLAESWTQHDARAEFPGRVISIDFDRFLASVAESMSRILDHFGLARDPRRLSQLPQSPALMRYSKAPEYAFTPADRIALLGESRRANGEEIRKGIAWLERIAKSAAGAAAVMNASSL